MGKYVFFIYIIAIIILLVVGKIFLVPLKKILKLIFNSLVGGVLLYFINIISSLFGVHIGINWIALTVTAFLGVPGVGLVVLLNLLL